MKFDEIMMWAIIAFICIGSLLSWIERIIPKPESKSESVKVETTSRCVYTEDIERRCVNKLELEWYENGCVKSFVCN